MQATTVSGPQFRISAAVSRVSVFIRARGLLDGFPFRFMHGSVPESCVHYSAQPTLAFHVHSAPETSPIWTEIFIQAAKFTALILYALSELIQFSHVLILSVRIGAVVPGAFTPFTLIAMPVITMVSMMMAA